MKPEEFAKAMAFLETACGKPIDAGGPQKAMARMEVFYDCLGDLDFEELMTGIRMVIMNHKWATFPSIAEIREAAAVGIMMDPAEGWGIAWKAAGKIDPEVEGSIERALKGLPDVVVEAMQTFGIPALCFGKEPVGVVRGQFFKIFEQVQARRRHLKLLPPSLRKEIALIKIVPPQEVRSLTNKIGMMDEGN